MLVIPLNPSNEPPISRLPDAMLIPFDENGRLISSNSHIMLGRVDGGYLMLELKLTGEKGSKSLMFKQRASLSEADVIQLFTDDAATVCQKLESVIRLVESNPPNDRSSNASV